MDSNRARAAVGEAFGYFQRNEPGKARDILRSVLKAEPKLFEALLLSGIIDHQQGKLDQALQNFERATEAAPQSPFGWCNLGVTNEALGRLDAAVTAYRAAIERNPNYFEAHFGCGNALRHQGKLAEALVSLDRAVAVNGLFAGAQCNRGIVLMQLERYDEALLGFDKAIALNRDFAEAHRYRGMALRAKGRLLEAMAALTRSTELTPGAADAHFERGSVLYALGRFEEAGGAFETGSGLRPATAQEHFEHGQALHMMRKFADALACFDRAIALDDLLVDARAGRVSALFESGEHAAAEAGCAALVAAHPENLALKALHAAIAMPPIADREAEIEAARKTFDVRLDALTQGLEASPTGYNYVGYGQPFFFGYHQHDNRGMLEKHGRMCAEAMTRRFGAGSSGTAGEPRPGGRLRVGIVSGDIRHHSVWHALVRGWIEHLDASKFEIHVFSLANYEDEHTAWCKARVPAFVQGLVTFEQWAEVIQAGGLDVLIHPALGLDRLSLKLASLRLAPLQVTAWGHPQTSGLPTIDAYLSGEAFEPFEGQDHYSEELVRLPGIASCYAPRPTAAVLSNVGQLGVAEGRPLIVCPGTPFKYTPRHDAVLIEIARRAPGAQIVFFKQPETAGLFAKVESRIRRAFEAEGMAFDTHCVVLPWQSADHFHALLQRADVMLDTIGFSGFNTAIEAMQSRVPIVAWEGRFLRGRLASGILRAGGLDDLVARDRDEYIDKVIGLIGKPQLRAETAARLGAAFTKLCNDRSSVDALGRWLEARGRAGARAPAGRA